MVIEQRGLPTVYTERHKLHATDEVLFEGHPFVNEQ